MVPMEVKTTGGQNCLNFIPSGNVNEAAIATVRGRGGVPQNGCEDLNFLSTIILGTWDSLDVHSSLFAEINLSVILIVGGLLILFKIPQGAGSSSLFTVCPSRISRMWQRQSEEPQPESSVKPDTARPVPEERGWGWNFFVYILPKQQ